MEKGEPDLFHTCFSGYRNGYIVGTKRRLTAGIEPDLPNTIILVFGPRQTWKMNLTKALNDQAGQLILG